MKKVLFILGQLTDQDVDWLARVGQRTEVEAGESIIDQGRPSPALFFVLSGRFGLEVGGAPVADAVMEVGEIVGELSFVDARPPSATVRAKERSVVLAVPAQVLRRRLDEDSGFAARFYFAVATMLSDRLRRATPGQAADADELDDDVFGDDEIDLNVLTQVSHAGERFERILRRFLEA